jgi:hypothetical protein
VVTAVKAVTDGRWVLLYVERWLAAPLEHLAASLTANQGNLARVGGRGCDTPRPPDYAAQRRLTRSR